MGSRRPDPHRQAASLHRDDCRASRTTEVYGRTLKFINGHAIPERIIQSGHIPDRLAYMVGHGLNWM